MEHRHSSLVQHPRRNRRVIAVADEGLADCGEAVPDRGPPAGNCYRNLHGYKSPHRFQDRRKRHADLPAAAPESPQSKATPGSAHAASASPSGPARAAAPRRAAPFPDRHCWLAPPRQAGLARRHRWPPASHWPRATITAGPGQLQLRVCDPASQRPALHREPRTCSRLGAPSSAIIAAALALVPVPEDEVGPTPRS